MAYSPDPNRPPRVPSYVWTVAAWGAAFVVLFTFAPVIVRALMGA